MTETMKMSPTESYSEKVERETNNSLEGLRNEVMVDFVTIDELSKKDKEMLKDRNEAKTIEIENCIEAINNKELNSEYKKEYIKNLLKLFSSNAKINYLTKGRIIQTHKIKEFFEDMKDWKISAKNIEIVDIIFDWKILRKPLPKIEWTPIEYVYEQKIKEINITAE